MSNLYPKLVHRVNFIFHAMPVEIGSFLANYISLKVRQSQNDFFKSTFLPKNNEQIQLYYCDTSGWLVFVRFLEEIEDTKKTFQD